MDVTIKLSIVKNLPGFSSECDFSSRLLNSSTSFSLSSTKDLALAIEAFERSSRALASLCFEPRSSMSRAVVANYSLAIRLTDSIGMFHTPSEAIVAWWTSLASADNASNSSEMAAVWSTQSFEIASNLLSSFVKRDVATSSCEHVARTLSI